AARNRRGLRPGQSARRSAAAGCDALMRGILSRRSSAHTPLRPLPARLCPAQLVAPSVAPFWLISGQGPLQPKGDTGFAGAASAPIAGSAAILAACGRDARAPL